MGVIGMVLVNLFIRLLGVEIGVHHMPLCRWLIRVAAARLPPEERAAAESEWLAVIDDLRSPTRQFVHAASYVWSALHIREAIAPETPETQITKIAKTLIALQLGGIGALTGVMTTIALEHREVLVRVAQSFAISKPVAIAVAAVVILMTCALTYLNYRIMIRFLERRARRRANDAGNI
jgi:hypothetical protein